MSHDRMCCHGSAYSQDPMLGTCSVLLCELNSEGPLNKTEELFSRSFK